MTATLRLSLAQALRRAAARATLAPSIHNSQPWQFVIAGNSLELHANRNRQLPMLDPAGRQLLISCGCALFNARVSLATAGYPSVVQRMPRGSRSTLLARLAIDEFAEDVRDLALTELDPIIELRHTNRRRFADEPVPTGLVDALVAAAAAEDAGLLEVRQAVASAALDRRAIELARTHPSYWAELRTWTTDEPDGLAEPGVPHCLLALWTATDDRAGWLRAGEALQRVLLEVTRRGHAAGILSQVAEVPAVRELLRRELTMLGAPHLLLRVGRAPSTAATRRRRLADVLVEHP